MILPFKTASDVMQNIPDRALVRIKELNIAKWCNGSHI